MSGGFHVEEYKKPEYEVRVTPDKKRVLQGSPVQALISARYFFGEPVARASVKYVVHKFRYWYPLYADPDEESDDSGDDNYYGQGEQILEESGQLDADGKLSVSIPTEMSPQKWDTRRSPKLATHTLSSPSTAMPHAIVRPPPRNGPSYMSGGK